MKVPEGMTLWADEVQFCKNRKAKRTQKMTALARATRAKGGRTFGLSGTPMRNRPSELFQVLDTFGCVEESFGHFGRFYFLMGGARGKYGTVWCTPKPDSVERLAKVMLRRERKDVLDLPPKTWQPILVEPDGECRRIEGRILDAFQRKGYDRLLDSDDGDLELLRSGLGIAFEEISAYAAALENSKIKAAEEIVESYEDAGEPIVVFGQHKEPVNRIGAREGWMTITGDTPMAERQMAVERFQRGELKGLALTIFTAGFGLTLTRAKTALFMSLPWTPADLEQAEDRICRIGQTSDRLLYIQLVANDRLEKRVCQLLAQKRALITSTVGAATHREGEVQTAAKVAAQAAEALAAATATSAQGATQTRTVAPDAPRTTSQPNQPHFRPAANRVEEWAARALLTLAGRDPDHAGILNGIGFNRVDGQIGHSFADQLSQRGSLSDKQWLVAIKIARHYPAQVGPCPEEE